MALPLPVNPFQNVTPAELLSPLGFVTLPFRGAAAVMSGLSGADQNRPTARGGQKATLGGKPVVFDAGSNKWEPDLSTPEGKDAWRAPGTRATLGSASVTWDPKEGWVADRRSANDSSLPPPPPIDTYTGGNIDTDTGVPPVPNLPAPTEGAPGTFPAPNTPLGKQQPDIDPRLPFDYTERMIRDYFVPLRERERKGALIESIVTSQLRDRGLRELSRRAIETENIKAWREIEVARQQAMSNQAIALANTAYLSQIPNTGIMQAMSETMKASMQPVSLSSVGTVG